MRVSGLSSGMDIDTLVQQMMKAQRVPLDKLTQQRQTVEWKRDAYKQVNSQLVDFRNNKLWKYKNSSEMNAFKSEVTGDTTAVSVKATPNSNQVEMKVEVIELASQRSKTSVDRLGADITGKSTLSSLGSKDEFSLTVSRGTDSSQSVTLTFSKNDSINSVIRKINSDPKANVTAALDEATGKITIKSKEYGSDAVEFSGDLTDAFKLTGAYEGGNKAKVKINDNPLEYTSNVFTINGVEITLNAKTDPSKPSIITSKTDSSKILDTIKSFIKDYNAVLSTINTKVSEERYRDFHPLTDEQKKDMKEDDIKRWEEKAQSGLLKNDEILKTTVFDMRESIVSAKVNGSLTNLSSIGITTGQYYENGKLILDEAGEAKLKKAIEENPEDVMELFIGSSDEQGTKGLFNELYDKLAAPLESISARAGTSKYSTDLTLAYNTESVMGKELKSLKERISATQRKLTTLETRYYTQFSAMENAINKLNSQSSSLSGFLAQ